VALEQILRNNIIQQVNKNVMRCKDSRMAKSRKKCMDDIMQTGSQDVTHTRGALQCYTSGRSTF